MTSTKPEAGYWRAIARGAEAVAGDRPPHIRDVDGVLADIFHWVSFVGFDIDELIVQARSHYEAELELWGNEAAWQAAGPIDDSSLANHCPRCNASLGHRCWTPDGDERYAPDLERQR